MRLRVQAASPDPSSDAHSFWAEQLARFDLAHIGTLHSFCLKLVREHFYELGLDPRLAVLDEGGARQLANEVLDEMFAAHYAGKYKFSPAVLNLIHDHGGGRDEPIRKLVLQLHHYSQARPDAAGWLAQQREKFSSPAPTDWERWLREAVENWRAEWLPVLEALPENTKAVELAGILSRWKMPEATLDWRSRGPGAGANRCRRCHGKMGREKRRLPQANTKYFHRGRISSIARGYRKKAWIRLRRIGPGFASRWKPSCVSRSSLRRNWPRAKQADGALDFHDLEQLAFKLLWNFSTGQPSAVAAGWRTKLKFVFVDEYQDINAAQDKIITALSREGTAANRFPGRRCQTEHLSFPLG